MPDHTDPIGILLRDAADERSAGIARPPLHALTASSKQSRSATRSLAPALAAAAVLAVVAGGSLLPRLHHPAPAPSASPARSVEDPELGTRPTPPNVMVRLPGSSATPPPAPPERVDVLSRVQLAEGVTLWTFGYLTDSERCTAGWLEDTTDATNSRPVGVGGQGCLIDDHDNYSGPPPQPSGPGVDPLLISRSSRSTNEPAEPVLAGSAPPGTTRVRLEGGGRTVDVVAYDGGPRWAHWAYFSTVWPKDVETTITALDAQSHVLSHKGDVPLDERRLAPKYYATQADCYRAAGYDVTVIPQGGGTPAYTWQPPSGSSAAQKASADQQCADEADRAVGIR